MQAEQSYPATTIGQQLISINRIQNKPQPNHCGYCNTNGSYSWGLTKQVMHPYTYEMLAERGWRRCGTYYYKPDIQKSCCKLWTHRMDVNRFRVKRDQRKTVQHVTEWLNQRMNNQSKSKIKQEKKKEHDRKGVNNSQKTNQQSKHTGTVNKSSTNNAPKAQKNIAQLPQKWQNVAALTCKQISQKIQQSLIPFVSLFSTHFISPDINPQQLAIPSQFIVKIFPSPSTNPHTDFYTNYVMLLFGLNKKLFKKQYNLIQFAKDVKKYIEEIANEKDCQAEMQVQRGGYLLYLMKDGQKMKNKLLKEKQIEKQKQIGKQNEPKMKMQMIKQKKVRSRIDKQNTQQKIKSQKPIKQQQKQDHTRFELSISTNEIYFGPLSIVIVPAQVTTESWKMYQRYSVQIHEKPEKSQGSYSGFLCQKALKQISETTQAQCDVEYSPSWQQDNDNKLATKIKGKRTKLMGCYHMKYYIGKQFIGVGVVDFFPHGLSSVYFFYEPKYKDLRLGVFSSLIQIQYIRWLSLSFPEYRYYYMGFYIQNCQKMEYKGNYQPFSLMCPITYNFVECTPQMRELITKIQKKQIESVQLDTHNPKIDDMNFTTDIGVFISQKLKIKYQGQNLTLRDLNPKAMIGVLSILRDIAQVWGKRLFEGFTITF